MALVLCHFEHIRCERRDFSHPNCLCLHLLVSLGAVIKEMPPGDGEHLSLCHAAHQTGQKKWVTGHGDNAVSVGWGGGHREGRLNGNGQGDQNIV